MSDIFCSLAAGVVFVALQVTTGAPVGPMFAAYALGVVGVLLSDAIRPRP